MAAATRRKVCKFFKVKLPLLLPAIMAVVAWLMIATVFYHFVGNCSTISEIEGDHVVEVKHCPWTLPMCFYYAVQAGLSIGFGLLSEDNDFSRLFTVYHILAGSSFIIGALGFFVQAALGQHVEIFSSEERRLAEFAAAINADGYQGFTLPQLRELLMTHPGYMRDLSLRLNKDYKVVQEEIKVFKTLPSVERRKLVDQVLEEACCKLDEFKHHACSIQHLVSLREEESGIKHRFKQLVEQNRSLVIVFAMFVVWATIGVVYLSVAQGTSFITGLYFAISSLSTGGLYAITPDTTGWPFIFVGLYCLTGVPIYALLLGMSANLLVQGYSARQATEKIQKSIDDAECEFLQHLLDEEHKTTVDVADYIEIQLLRLGKVDRGVLRTLREEFGKLDRDGTGKVPKAEFLREEHQKLLKHKKEEEEEESSQTTASHCEEA